LIETFRVLSKGEPALPFTATFEEKYNGFSINSKGFDNESACHQDPVVAAWVDIVNTFPKEFKEDARFSSSPSPEYIALLWRGYCFHKRPEGALGTICDVNLLFEECHRFFYRTLGIASLCPPVSFHQHTPKPSYRLDAEERRHSVLHNVEDETDFVAHKKITI